MTSLLSPVTDTAKCTNHLRDMTIVKLKGFHVFSYFIDYAITAVLISPFAPFCPVPHSLWQPPTLVNVHGPCI